MIDRFYILFILILILNEVESLVCYHNGLGIKKYFYCSPHEYCCGNTCCQSYIRLSFYRLWYFWLTVIMILIFCSGSGYWFRRRYYQPEMFMNAPNTNSGGLVIRRGETRFDSRDSTTRGVESTAHPMSPPSYSVHGAPVQAPAFYAYQMYGPPPAYEAVYPANQQPVPPVYAANGAAASATPANQSATNQVGGK